MTGPTNRPKPSPPIPVNAVERFLGHIIKRDSEGFFYWTAPDGSSTAALSVDACRRSIEAYVDEHEPAELNDMEIEEA